MSRHQSYACNACGFDMKELNTVIDDGKHRMVLCPNHLLMNFLGMSISWLTKPEASLFTPAVHCDLCAKKAIYFEDANDRFNVCMDHAKALVRRNLTPEQFYVLYAKHPTAHLLHDDFYDPNTGESLQPV